MISYHNLGEYSFRDFFTDANHLEIYQKIQLFEYQSIWKGANVLNSNLLYASESQLSILSILPRSTNILKVLEKS